MERQQWQQRVEASLVLVSCPRGFSKARAEHSCCQMHLHPISMLLDATVPMLEAEAPCQMRVVNAERCDLLQRGGEARNIKLR